MKIKQKLVALQITSVFNIHIQYNELQQSVSDKKTLICYTCTGKCYSETP